MAYQAKVKKCAKSFRFKKNVAMRLKFYLGL